MTMLAIQSSLTIDELKQKILKEMTRLSNQFDALDDATVDPVIHEYHPEIKPKVQVRKRIPSVRKQKRSHSPRYYLNEQYRGMSVGSAAMLAASRMGDTPFTASDIGKKIYDYRGVVRFSRMHSVIGSKFISDPRCVRVDRGVYMWDDGMQVSGTHDKKLSQLIDRKTDHPDVYPMMEVE